MPHKNFTWKISDQKILNIIHETLLKIFKSNNYKININDICFYLNISPIKIHSNQKYNTLLSYIKINQGGILQFLQKYNCISILSEKKQTMIIFDIDHFIIYGWNNRITDDSEWILIENNL